MTVTADSGEGMEKVEPPAGLQTDTVSEHEAQNTSSSSSSSTDALAAFSPPPLSSVQTSAPPHKRRRTIVPYNAYIFFGAGADIPRSFLLPQAINRLTGKG